MNPIQGIKVAPNWNWPTMLSVQLAINILLGAVSDLLVAHSVTFVRKIIFLPFISIATCFLGACFFYFLILFIYNRQISFHRTYTLVFLALIPFLILRILSPLISPINLIGFAITLILLTVGFVENFQLPKKSIIKVFGGIFAAYFILWSIQQINSSRREMHFKNLSPSKDLENENLDDVDKIEEEIDKSF